MREQVEMLKHHANLAPDAVDLAHIVRQFHVVDNDLALLMLFQSVNAANERGFTRTGWATYNDPLTVADCQVEVLQHVEIAVPLVHALHPNNVGLANV